MRDDTPIRNISTLNIVDWTTLRVIRTKELTSCQSLADSSRRGTAVICYYPSSCILSAPLSAFRDFAPHDLTSSLAQAHRLVSLALSRLQSSHLCGERTASADCFRFQACLFGVAMFFDCSFCLRHSFSPAFSTRSTCLDRLRQEVALLEAYWKSSKA